MSVEIYNPTVVEHFQNPRNVGEIPDADAVGAVGSPVCYDIMTLYLKIENGRIADAKFKTMGCGAAIASSSMATELIKGKTIEEALELTEEKVVEALGGLPQPKIHCSILAVQALRRALDKYLKESGSEGLRTDLIDQEYPEVALPDSGASSA